MMGSGPPVQDRVERACPAPRCPSRAGPRRRRSSPPRQPRRSPWSARGERRPSARAQWLLPIPGGPINSMGGRRNTGAPSCAQRRIACQANSVAGAIHGIRAWIPAAISSARASVSIVTARTPSLTGTRRSVSSRRDARSRWQTGHVRHRPCAALDAVEVVLGDRVRSRIERHEVGIVDLMPAQAHQVPAETPGYLEPVGDVVVRAWSAGRAASTWSCPFLEPARGSRRHAAPPGREAAAGEVEEKNPGLGDIPVRNGAPGQERRRDHVG